MSHVFTDIHVGAASANSWRSYFNTVPKDNQVGAVELARWMEPHVYGKTERLVKIRYSEIPALIAILAQALVDKAERDEMKSRIESLSA